MRPQNSRNDGPVRIGCTLGDPAGIGPELLLRVTADVGGDVQPVLFGSKSLLDRTADLLGLARYTGELVDVADGEVPLSFGHPDAGGATLQYRALTAAIEAARRGRIDAIVTAPWTKHILQLAGIEPTGHTEVLGRECGVASPTMMLCGDTLRVALTTVHLPLADVPGRIDEPLIRHRLDHLHTALARDFAIDAPRIAVCGLNPHAGERGIMGSEEVDVIGPAVEAARADGLDVSGPFPADTLFARVARSKRFDAILAMYHDQGLAPLKLWHFGASANVTLGLPIVRTSPDHGTAYDIAGQGIADIGSTRYAWDLAVRIARNRRAGSE